MLAPDRSRIYAAAERLAAVPMFGLKVWVVVAGGTCLWCIGMGLIAHDLLAGSWKTYAR